jgi:hypothetical protein
MPAGRAGDTGAADAGRSPSVTGSISVSVAVSSDFDVPGG